MPGTPLLALLLLVGPDSSQSAAPPAPPGGGSAVVQAVRTARAPEVDARLDEDIWSTAQAVGEFRQVTPRDGEPGTERTEVWIAYDREALYVAARLHESDPSAIVARLGRRDSDAASDRFAVFIDSYHDHRTAFRFGVNAAGVKSDGVSANDASQTDWSWDPVWEVATRTDSLGWVVEMRIPFSQLRFSGDPRQTWGINFERFVFRKAELQRWSWRPNTEQGFASHFGHLTGVDDIPAPRRLELMPYTVAQGDWNSAAERRDPFDARSHQGLSGGLDLRYGVTSNLTLSATINPDFGQVEADPAEMNLTVFETQFAERRPFFVEGANLYAFGAGAGGAIFGAPQLFYSRRVGRSPTRFVRAPGGFVDAPEQTTILGAAKVSGQTGGWSLGALQAVTSRETARVQHADGARTTEVVEPLATYGVASLRRAFRGGLTGVGLMGTMVHRELDDDALRFLRSDAWIGGMDVYHRFGGNRYSVSGTASASLVRGSEQAMLLTQRSSARYFQRPDQDYATLDPEARELAGYALSLTAGKVAGNWIYGTDAFAYSPGFEVNDAGFQQQVDRVFHGVRLGRRWLRPTRYTRTAQLQLNASQQWNFGGTRVSRGIFPSAYVQLLNYWSIATSGQISFASQNDKLTRGGPLSVASDQWVVQGNVSSDQRKPVATTFGGHTARSEAGSHSRSLFSELALRPSSALTFTLGPSWNRGTTMAGYVGERADPTATHMYGRRYLFSDLTTEQWDVRVRADWALSPTVSVQLFAQPFVSMADYEGFKELARVRDNAFNYFGVDGASTLAYDAEARRYTVDPDGPGAAPAQSFADPDFRYRSLRANLVLRWEYRPGSLLYVGWAHGRSATMADADFSAGREFTDLLGDEQKNRLLVKATYFISR